MKNRAPPELGEASGEVRQYVHTRYIHTCLGTFESFAPPGLLIPHPAPLRVHQAGRHRHQRPERHQHLLLLHLLEGEAACSTVIASLTASTLASSSSAAFKAEQAPLRPPHLKPPHLKQAQKGLTQHINTT